MELTDAFGRMFAAVSETELRKNPRVKKKILKMRFLIELFDKAKKRTERSVSKDETKTKSIHKV